MCFHLAVKALSSFVALWCLRQANQETCIWESRHAKHSVAVQVSP